MAQQIQGIDLESNITHLQEDFAILLNVNYREICNLVGIMNSTTVYNRSAKAIDINISITKNDYLMVAHKFITAFIGYLTAWKEVLKVETRYLS